MNYSNEKTPYDERYYKNYNLPSNRKKKNIYGYVIILFVLSLITFIIYFLFFKVDEEVEEKQAEFIMDICETALEYIAIKGDIITNNIPGAVSYVKVQDLIDENLLSDEQLINPVYEENILGYSKYEQYLSTNLYVRLAVGDDGSIFCEGITDKNK